MEASPSYNLLVLFSAGRLPSEGCDVKPFGVSGIWKCDDGGLYYVRQIGPDILWYGEAQPDRPFFANVAHGHIKSAGRIRLMWADVPKGITGACGALMLHVDSDSEMHATKVPGGFGGQRWTRWPGRFCRAGTVHPRPWPDFCP